MRTKLLIVLCWHYTTHLYCVVVNFFCEFIWPVSIVWQQDKKTIKNKVILCKRQQNARNKFQNKNYYELPRSINLHKQYMDLLGTQNEINTSFRLTLYTWSGNSRLYNFDKNLYIHENYIIKTPAPNVSK